MKIDNFHVQIFLKKKNSYNENNFLWWEHYEIWYRWDISLTRTTAA